MWLCCMSIVWLEDTDVSEFFRFEIEVLEGHMSESQVPLLLFHTRLNIGYVEMQMEYQYW